MNFYLKSLLIGCAYFAYVGNLHAVSKEEITSAQLEMNFRVGKEVEAYAKEINVEENYIWYCRMEMYLKSSSHPIDGSIPFGVNYFQLKDLEHLRIVIVNKENYEKSYLKICLAKIKKILKDAK
jgi:hypothetical protein